MVFQRKDGKKQTEKEEKWKTRLKKEQEKSLPTNPSNSIEYDTNKLNDKKNDN